jgi:hypothetical protein
MTRTSHANPTGATRWDPEGAAASLRAANFLCLAATPSFAIMATLTDVFGGGPMDALCATAHDASPLNGMVLMYALMSTFHSAPWLRLASRVHGGAHRS